MIAHAALRAEVSFTNRAWVRALASVILLATPTQSLFPIGPSGINWWFLIIVFLLATPLGFPKLLFAAAFAIALAIALARTGPGT